MGFARAPRKECVFPRRFRGAQAWSWDFEGGANLYGPSQVLETEIAVSGFHATVGLSIFFLTFNFLLECYCSSYIQTWAARGATCKARRCESSRTAVAGDMALRPELPSMRYGPCISCCLSATATSHPRSRTLDTQRPNLYQ